MTTPDLTPSALLEPNTLPKKGVAIPKYDLRSIWQAMRFTPHDGQEEVFRGWAVHNVTTVVAGTRWGKSEFAGHLPLAHIAPCWKEITQDGRRVRVDHRTIGAVIAPTYELTGIVMGKLYAAVLKLCKVLGYPINKKGRRGIAVSEVMDVEDVEGLPDLEPEPGMLSLRKVNGVIKTIVTPWGSRFDAYTMKDPRGLLGKAFDWIITDESGQFDDQDWNNYYEYADRALIDREGWVYHGTTPKGFNALYTDFFEKGQPGPKRDGDYISFQQPTHRNSHLNPDWLEKKRKNTPKRLWNMNYLAQFTILEGQVYEEFDRATHVRTFKPRPEWFYFLGVDFGYTDPFVSLLMAWTGEEFVVIDEVYKSGLSTPEQKRRVAAMLQRNLPPGAQFLDGRAGKWTIWGDPRGGQNRADWAKLGAPVRTPHMHLGSGQKGSIDATAGVVAEWLHPIEDRPYPLWAARPGDALGAPRIIIHERCTGLIHSLQSWVKKGEKYSGDDHGSDSIRYGLLGARPYAKPLEELVRHARRHDAPPGKEPGARRMRSKTLRDSRGNKLSLGLR